MTDLVAPLNFRFTGYPEVGKSSPPQPAPVAGADKCNSTSVRWHNLIVADVNTDDNAVLRVGFAATRLAWPYSRSVSAATVAIATAVRNAARKCGGDSDMTSTVATSKVTEGGFPSALSAALSRAGIATFRDRSRYRVDHFAGRRRRGRPHASARSAVATVSGLIHFPLSHGDTGRPAAQKKTFFDDR